MYHSAVLMRNRIALLRGGRMTGRMAVWNDWFYVVAPFLFYLAVVYVLVAMGRSDKKNILPQFFDRISNSLHRATGYPGWAMAGALSGLLVLLVAAMGLYWDVAWHVDLGRDELLSESVAHHDSVGSRRPDVRSGHRSNLRLAGQGGHRHQVQEPGRFPGRRSHSLLSDWVASPPSRSTSCGTAPTASTSPCGAPPTFSCWAAAVSPPSQCG